MAPGLRSSLAHNATRAIVRFLLLPYWQPQPQGLHNLPMHGPLLVCANHPTILDPLLLVAHFPRRLSILMAREVRTLPLVGPAFHQAGHVTVGPECLDQCEDRLRDNTAVGIFPEGGHSYSDTLGVFRSGIAVLAQRTGAPVLPVAILGNQSYMAPRATIMRGGPVMISFGKPLHCHPHEPARDFLERLHQAIAQQMEDLKQADRPWRPDWRYHLWRAIWLPISRALFAVVDKIKPDNVR